MAGPSGSWGRSVARDLPCESWAPRLATASGRHALGPLKTPLWSGGLKSQFQEEAKSQLADAPSPPGATLTTLASLEAREAGFLRRPLRGRRGLVRKASLAVPRQRRLARVGVGRALGAQLWLRAPET